MKPAERRVVEAAMRYSKSWYHILSIPPENKGTLYRLVKACAALAKARKK